MLAELQRQISDTYRLESGHDVRDFLITDPVLARVIGQDAMLTGSDETLFIAQDDEGIALSLYLDQELLERLESADPLNTLQPESLDDLWKVLEGISHFSCVAFKADRDREVSLLEVELQGEIDKFVSSMRLALQQADAELHANLHGWLFENVRFHDDLDGESLDRYRAANDYAARFCHGLQAALVNEDPQVLDDLRTFYRLPISEKLSYIHARAW